MKTWIENWRKDVKNDRQGFSMMPTSKNDALVIPFTKVPKSFFKCVLPNVSGSELAVCLVIIDKTCGFHKEEDSISYSQFCKATGLATSTVELAIAALLSKGFIARRSGKRYKGLEQIYRYTPPEDKPKLSSIKGGRKSNNDMIREML